MNIINLVAQYAVAKESTLKTMIGALGLIEKKYNPASAMQIIWTKHTNNCKYFIPGLIRLFHSKKRK